MGALKTVVLVLKVAQGAENAVSAMVDGGLLLPIFGGVAYIGPFAAMVAAEGSLGLKPDPVRRPVEVDLLHLVPPAPDGQ